jgi:hypothetical protein
MDDKFIDKLHRILTNPVNIFSGALLLVLLTICFVGLPVPKVHAPRIDQMRQIAQTPKYFPAASRHNGGPVSGYSGPLA